MIGYHPLLPPHRLYTGHSYGDHLFSWFLIHFHHYPFPVHLDSVRKSVIFTEIIKFFPNNLFLYFTPPHLFLSIKKLQEQFMQLPRGISSHDTMIWGFLKIDLKRKVPSVAMKPVINWLSLSAPCRR